MIKKTKKSAKNYDTVPESLTQYYSDLNAVRFLSAQEEHELFLRYFNCRACGRTHAGAAERTCTCGKSRDYRALDTLVKSVLLYVVQEAKALTSKLKGARDNSDTIQEFIAAGNVGVVVAANKFDISRGTRFLTYAAQWIRERMFEEMYRRCVVQVPVYLQKREAKKRREKDPKAMDLRVKPLSLETFELDTVYGVQPNLLEFEAQEQHNKIHRMFAELGFDNLTRTLVLMYQGYMEDSRTLDQISRVVQVPPEKLRVIKQKALRRMAAYIGRTESGS